MAPALLPAAALLGLLAAMPAGAAAPKVADITAIKGDARVVRAVTKELVDGEEDVDLFEGDEVATLAGGNVTITFVDHHLLKLGEKTTMVIKTVKADPRTGGFLGRVRLLSGRLFASFGKSSGTAKTGFAVETRSAVAAVKGTTFGVEEGDAGSTVSVEEGVVATAPVDEQGREGQAVDVPEGQETSVDARTRKLGGLRGFLNDDRRKWMKEELTGLKGYAGRFREMKRSGDLDRIRELRGLAREGKLHKAGPRLQAMLLRNPGLRAQLLEHADRHKRNFMNRGQRMKTLRGAAEGAGQQTEHGMEKSRDAGGKQLDRGLDRLKNLRRKKD